MTKRGFEKLWRVRDKILTDLDETGWAWDRNLSLLLDQLDLLLREKR